MRTQPEPSPGHARRPDNRRPSGPIPRVSGISPRHGRPDAARGARPRERPAVPPGEADTAVPRPTPPDELPPRPGPPPPRVTAAPPPDPPAAAPAPVPPPPPGPPAARP